ncbi:MAG: protein kinase, partial [Bdellovibrionales bacterium]|nr:protein kinase [Bdellovibrionales bacterium]
MKMQIASITLAIWFALACISSTSASAWPFSNRGKVIRIQNEKDGRIQSFKILELIGEGAYGEVFKAFDLKTKSYVAIKLINLEASLLPKNNVQAWQEALEAVNELSEKEEILLTRMLRNYSFLLSPSNNFVTVRGFGQQIRDSLLVSKKLAVVMNLLDEDSHHLFKSLPLNPENNQYIERIELTEAFIDFSLAALQELKEKDLIHGDIKPQNILYSRHHHKFFLTDFDNLHFADEKLIALISTPPYRPPEWNRVDKIRSYQSDLYSFAVSLLDLLVDLDSIPALMVLLEKATKSPNQERFLEIKTEIQALLEAQIHKRFVQPSLLERYSAIESFIWKAFEFNPEDRQV